MLMRKPSATARQAPKLKAEIERDLLEFDPKINPSRPLPARNDSHDDKSD